MPIYSCYFHMCHTIYGLTYISKGLDRLQQNLECMINIMCKMVCEIYFSCIQLHILHAGFMIVSLDIPKHYCFYEWVLGILGNNSCSSMLNVNTKPTLSFQVHARKKSQSVLLTVDDSTPVAAVTLELHRAFLLPGILYLGNVPRNMSL